MSCNRLILGALSSVLFCALAQQPAWSQAAGTATGKFVVEAPTLNAIGVEWKIAGDDNTNAMVAVSYRKKGEQAWREALPLFRLHHEVVNGEAKPFQTVEPSPESPRGEREDPWHYDVGNMFSGSILGLEPGTEYECRFVLSDPDGVSGDKEKTVTVTTRKPPQTNLTGGRVFHVYPIDWTGPKQQPAFTGLMRAYNLGASASDHEHAFPPRVHPGDTILVHAGAYVSDRFHYLAGMPHEGWLGLAAPSDGTYYLTQNGTLDKPIVIKAAGDGEVIFDGAGNANLFNVMHANYNYFEGITVRNTTVAFLVGWKDIAGASGFALIHSRIYDVGRAVQDEWSQSRDLYIADNYIIGRHPPAQMMGWDRNGPWINYPGFPEHMLSEYGVKIYGQGHVITHNYVANWHDGIDISTYGEPDGTPDIDGQEVTGPTPMDDRIATSIDITRNDIYNMGDNCVETDGGSHNLRVIENRCANTGQHSLSAQPDLGGPDYFIKNIVYNSPAEGPIKLNETPAGVLFYQNTFVGGDASGGRVANIHFRNNLILGRGTQKPVLNIRTTTNYSSSDYNGYALNKGPYNFEWDSPPDGVAADYDWTHKLTVRRFKTLKEFSDATGLEKHSVQIGYGTFVNVPLPDDAHPLTLYNPEEMDFRLKPNSPAIGGGVPLPTINDGYKGKGPDLGALQSGQPIPDFGPRDWPAPRELGFRSWDGPLAAR